MEGQRECRDIKVINQFTYLANEKNQTYNSNPIHLYICPGSVNLLNVSVSNDRVDLVTIFAL